MHSFIRFNAVDLKYNQIFVPIDAKNVFEMSLKNILMSI